MAGSARRKSSVVDCCWITMQWRKFVTIEILKLLLHLSSGFFWFLTWMPKYPLGVFNIFKADKINIKCTLQKRFSF